MKQAKTNGLEWLYLSMASFNGSGYAIKHTPQTYLDSYIAYKKWKKQHQAVELAQDEHETAYMYAEKLRRAAPAGHTPSDKNQARFMEFYIKEYAV
jgi:hypothetical protein